MEQKRYIALLRGVNISGKNKISMPELKAEMTDRGFSRVQTHLNSGNVVFSVPEECESALASSVRGMIRERFGLDIPVFVISQEQLESILHSAPDWWGTEDKEKYDNLIFVMPPASAEQIRERIGEPTEELERIFLHENVIFWTFDRQKYAKANWWKKTAAPGIGELITIRTANTLKKIARI